MQDIIKNLPKLAKDRHKENKNFFAKLKKKPPKQLDYLMQELHDEEFKKPNAWNVLIAVRLLDHYLQTKMLCVLRSILK